MADLVQFPICDVTEYPIEREGINLNPEIKLKLPPESLGVIKTFSNMSVQMFINSHRIEYAIKLINDGYLQNYSIEALAGKSGFNSQENFNRVFKLLKKVTPSEFRNSKE